MLMKISFNGISIDCPPPCDCDSAVIESGIFFREVLPMIQFVKTDRQSCPNYKIIREFQPENVQNVIAYHKSFPEYSVTPMANLRSLASELGLHSLHVKDESYRFGLNSFKVLGGSYAVGRIIADRLGIDIGQLSYPLLVSRETAEKLGDFTLITATDGNHGRGIAWTANRLQQRSVVYMPKGTAADRLNHILCLGSDASVTDLNYDDAVRLASRHAQENGWILVQDTSWPGYEEIPRWIMQGYTTMAYEASLQLQSIRPTHIFLQAGVGSMAAAVTAFFANLYREDPEKPKIYIVEPTKADCLYRSALAGSLQKISGDLDSIMAGLCCGEPCTVAWEILKEHVSGFFSVSDDITEKGMRSLARGLGTDPSVVSGESGAVTTGLVAELMTNPDCCEYSRAIGLNRNSRVLCFSTEGATDRENYRKIVNDTKD